jgi:hypothetical protein
VVASFNRLEMREYRSGVPVGGGSVRNANDLFHTTRRIALSKEDGSRVTSHSEELETILCSKGVEYGCT